jgi:hypothetical protein
MEEDGFVMVLPRKHAMGETSIDVDDIDFRASPIKKA